MQSIKDILYIIRIGQLTSKEGVNKNNNHIIRGVPNNLFQKLYIVPQILSHIVDGITVTDEISWYQNKLSRDIYNCSLVANGLDFEEISPIFRPLRFSHILTSMIIDSYNNCHCLERLAESLFEPNENSTYSIFIVGNVTATIQILFDFLNRILFYPILKKDKMMIMIHEMHQRIGRSALYINDIAQACSLKVGKYFLKELGCDIRYDVADFKHQNNLIKYVS